jgi:hypothetical protein
MTRGSQPASHGMAAFKLDNMGSVYASHARCSLVVLRILNVMACWGVLCCCCDGKVCILYARC